LYLPLFAFTSTMVSAPPTEGHHLVHLTDNSEFISTLQVEPVGRWFLSHWSRLNCHRGISVNSAHSAQNDDDASESEDDSDDNQETEIVFEDDIVYLRSLDPKVRKSA
jgi:hypothetical protein